MPIAPFGGERERDRDRDRSGRDKDGNGEGGDEGELEKGRTAHPRKLKSPFLKGIKGPGYLGKEGSAGTEPPILNHSTSSFAVTTAPTGMSSTIGTGAAGAGATIAKNSATPTPSTPAPSTPNPTSYADQQQFAGSTTGRRPYTKRGTGAIAQRKAKEAADAAAAAREAAAAATAQVSYIPPPLTGPSVAAAASARAVGGPGAAATQNAQQQQKAQVQVQRKRKMEDRTAVSASGGQPYLRDAKIETLPQSTGELSLLPFFDARPCLSDQSVLLMDGVPSSSFA